MSLVKRFAPTPFTTKYLDFDKGFSNMIDIQITTKSQLQQQS